MNSENHSSENKDGKNMKHRDSMSFMDHLEELRVRLIRVFIVLSIMILITYAFRKDILDLVRKPVEEPLKRHTAGLVVKPSEIQKPVASLNSLNCVCQPVVSDLSGAESTKQTSGLEDNKAAPDKDVAPAPSKKNILLKWWRIVKNTINDFAVFFKSAISDEPPDIPNENPASEKTPASEAIALSDSGVVNLSCACKPKSDLQAPSGSHSSMVYIGLPELFFAQMKAAIFAALFLAFPYFLIEIWGFVGPALYRSERKIFWVFALFSYLFFIGGALFGYFVVFPFGFDFFLSLTQMGEIMPSLSIGEYLSLSIKMLLAFGFIFELPLITFILARLGVVTPELMIKQSRVAVLVIFIAGAMLTPPDPFTMLLMAGPLVLLYIISIGVCYLGVNRQKAALRSQGIEDEDFKVD